MKERRGEEIKRGAYSATAIDAPIPLVPPVTKAVLPSREKREARYSDGFDIVAL